MTQLLLVVAAVLCGLMLPSRALACSVCVADDAAHSLLGSGPPARIRIADDNLFLQKTQGDEKHREWRSNVGVSYTVSERVSTALTIPWVWKSLEHEGERTHTRGVGDAELLGRVVVWRDRSLLPSEVWRVSAGALLPTGNNWLRQTSHHGETELVEEHAQIGNGAFGAVVGTDYQHYGDVWSWGGSLISRIPGANSRGFRYGAMLLGSATLTYSAEHWVSVGVSPLLRYAWRDVEDGARDENSGGLVAYIEPVVQLALPPISVRAKAALPVATNLYGEQTEYPILGLLVAWNI